MEEDGIGVLLLGDIQRLFREEDTARLSSQEIADKLSNLEERPWADWKKGKPISTNQIARILKNYEVRPNEMKINRRNVRGYKAEDLQDTFERYLGTPDQTATPLPCSNDAAFREIESATQQTEVAGETGLKPAPNKESSVVADQVALMGALADACSGLPITPEQLKAEADPDDYKLLIEDPALARVFAESAATRMTS